METESSGRAFERSQRPLSFVAQKFLITSIAKCTFHMMIV
jgi:hypothetical protein